MGSMEWLRAEAARQGIALTDDDFEAVRASLERLKDALAAMRSAERELPEPAFRFSPAGEPV